VRASVRAALPEGLEDGFLDFDVIAEEGLDLIRHWQILPVQLVGDLVHVVVGAALQMPSAAQRSVIYGAGGEADSSAVSAM
jgi:hypothetical protein